MLRKINRLINVILNDSSLSPVPAYLHQAGSLTCWQPNFWFWATGWFASTDHFSGFLETRNMRTLWSCKGWKISTINFPFWDIQKGSKCVFGRTAKPAKSLRYKGKQKRIKEVCNLALELDIIFVRVRLELPRWDPEGSHSLGLVSTAGLWLWPTLNTLENLTEVCLCISSESSVVWNRSRKLGLGWERGRACQRDPWPLSSPLKHLH